MSTYQRTIPCIFIKQGNAIKGFDNTEVICEDAVELAKEYSESGAYELCVVDLSDSDVEHDLSIDIMKKINRVIHIPMIAGGNVKRLEDVKKMLYAGAKKAVVDVTNAEDITLLEEVSKRFGKEKILVSVDDEKVFLQYKTEIEMYASEVLFCHCDDENAVVDMTNLKTIVLTETKDMIRISTSEDLLESKIPFSKFKLNGDGLIPVIVQDYKTSDVLMLAYMNQDAYEYTLKTGKMTYYSRSRKERWIKGETSGHYQYVKSLTLDCDNDTILAKVDQVGVACHTGAKSCFFQSLVEADSDVLNPLQVFESVYATILDRKVNPKEGSYTNYLFDKGIDKILKKVGEEATELVIAAKNPNPEEIKYELSDFLYHAMVLMVEKGVSWDDIVKELADR